MTNKIFLSVFVTFLLIIAPILALQKHKLPKDEAKIIQLQDADFFNKIYIEGRDYLVLVIPDDCKECKGLMLDFQKNKEKIAEDFPDGSIGYIFGKTEDNILVRRAVDANLKSSSLVVKAFIKNRLFTYEGNVVSKKVHTLRIHSKYNFNLNISKILRLIF